jgi:hypothetical protein
MALTAFTSRLGQGQGRLETPKAASGACAFVLGDVEPGRVFELVAGDHADVTQSADLTGVNLVRAYLRLRAPENVPAGLAWEAALIVDGVALARMRSKPGLERVVTDLAANVSKLSGVHVVGVRLQLVAA